MRTKLSISMVFCMVCLAGMANAATLRERWGPEGMACTYPNTLQTLKKGKIALMEFDLSALPKDAKRQTLKIAIEKNLPKNTAKVIVTKNDLLVVVPYNFERE